MMSSPLISASRSGPPWTAETTMLAARLVVAFTLLCFARLAFGAELTAPKNAVAGQSATLHSSVSGTLVLVGPGHASKRKVEAGDVTIPAEDLSGAGNYIAAVGGESVRFTVAPGEAKALNFLARPSRVPVSHPGAISGVAFIFDANHNLVLAPTPVQFTLAVEGAALVNKPVLSSAGVAWTKLDSGKTAGMAQFNASLKDEQSAVRRVVQQVASEPCNLHFGATRSARAIEVETSPIKDCSGNPVPDGTIISFTQVDENGRSTVDARVKRGIAKAQLPLAGSANISIASGVVTGNEVKIGGGR